MRIVVLVPGIMGSRLTLNGEEIWPPTIPEIKFGYGRLSKLLDPAVRATDVIRQVVSCYQVYGSLIDHLKAWGFGEPPRSGSAGLLICWPYDWRLDNRLNAAALSATLAGLVRDYGAGTDLVLLPHSMGGLICRYALEANDASLGSVAWRGSCSLLVTMATPHRGAPLALVRALGTEGSLGISGPDVKKLTEDPRYPAAYQLLPPAEAFAFWAWFSTGIPLAGIDVLDPMIATQLGLNASNVKAASDLHRALSMGTRPPACRYFTFIGRRIKTVIRGDFMPPSTLVPSFVHDGGDGTVPIWSGTLPDTQYQLDGAEHSRTFRDPDLLSTLGELLGVSRATPITSSTWPVQVLLPKAVFLPSEAMSISLQVRNTRAVNGLALKMNRISESGEAVDSAVSVLAVTAPESKTQAAIVETSAPSSAGLYSVQALSSGEDPVSEQEAFAVQGG
jgi:hypothetical protein